MTSTSNRQNQDMYSKLSVEKLLNSFECHVSENIDLIVVNSTTLSPSMESKLGLFFRDINADPDCTFFRPHALSPQYASKLKSIIKNDIYLVSLDNISSINGYCFLRGWDDGWDTPSLGICLHSEARGKGLSKLLMSALHGIAKFKQCKKVRLTVDNDNLSAISLYKSFGYELSRLDDQRLIGFKYL